MKPDDLAQPADRDFVEGAGGVSFDVAIGDRRVPCYVTRETLEAYFGAPADADHRQASLEAFDRHAATLQVLARRQWRHRGSGMPALVLTVDAVFRTLTRS